MITENISLENNNFKKILLCLEKTKQKNIFDDEFINNFEAEIKNQILIKKIKEEFKGKQKYKKVIQDKINIIKIYIDFKNLYQKFKNIMSQPISQTFEDIVTNKNLFENKETLKLFIDDFDLLYKRIKINLFHLSNKFFKKISPEKLKFFNRIYMIRIFIAIFRKEKKYNKLSLINNLNNISKELISD